jgi:hypothetical protein
MQREQVQVVSVTRPSHGTDVRFSIFGRHHIQMHALIAATPAPMAVFIQINFTPKYVKFHT